MKRWIHAKIDVNSIPEKLENLPYVFTLRGENSTWDDDILAIAEHFGATKVKYQEVNPKTGNLFREGYWKFAVPSEKVAQDIFDAVKEYKIPTRQDDISIVKIDWNDNYNIWIDDYEKGKMRIPFNSEFKKAEASVKAKGTSITASNQWAKYRLAEDTLKKYSKEQIDYVQDCYDRVLKDISDYYTWDEADGDAPQIHTDSIKTDYLVGAIEDDLMEEEDFEDIYTALETLGERDAMAYA